MTQFHSVKERVSLLLEVRRQIIATSTTHEVREALKVHFSFFTYFAFPPFFLPSFVFLSSPLLLITSSPSHSSLLPSHMQSRPRLWTKWKRCGR